MTHDLSDVTFMIPVKIDSEDRINNLNIVTIYLREHFNTNIIIAEQNDTATIPNVLAKSLYNTYILYKTDSYFFHKTRLVNAMAKKSNTSIVAMYDSDILLGPDQYLDAANKLRLNTVDFIYPFNGRCINVPKNQIPQVLDSLRFDFVRSKFSNNKDLALGGCVMYKKDVFVNGGMMNENFISYGPEDGEQDLRFKKLGYRSYRIPKPLYHLEHARTTNSMENHRYSKQNWNEIRQIRQMSRVELERYVQSWSWTK